MVNILSSVPLILQLIVYLPFKDTSVMISLLAAEISTVIVLCMTTLFLADISPQTSATIEKSIMFTVIGSMGIQFIVSIYSMFLTLHLMWKKIIKYRALTVIKAHDLISTDHNS